MALEISRKSWLTSASLLDYQGTLFWDTPNFPEIVPRDDDTFIDIEDKYVGRLDLLAFDKYGDSNLWWVIALANGIDLIPTDVYLNRRLRLPSKSYVQALLTKRKR